MDQKLNAMAVGYVSAIIAAILMLFLGIAGNFGIYTGAAEQMMQWHLFFDLSVVGIVGGIIGAAFVCFVVGYAFARLYNKFTA